MKTNISMISAFAFATLALTGCGNNDDYSSNEPSMTPDQISSFKKSNEDFWDAKGFKTVAEEQSLLGLSMSGGKYSCLILEHKQTHNLYQGCNYPNSTNVSLKAIDRAPN